MNKKPSVLLPALSGAALGGMVVGTSEAIYRDVEWFFGLALYGTLWAAAGLGIALAWKIIIRRETLLGAGPWGWGLGAALGASAVVLVRFIIIRDVFNESGGDHRIALAVAGACGLALVVLGVFVGRLAQDTLRRLTPLTLAAVVAVPVIVFTALSFRGDDQLGTDSTADKTANGRGVILVVVDTLRQDALGVYGAKPHRGRPATPHLDAFAKNALVFTDVSAQASWTKPAMASMMTSRHVSGHNTMSKVASLPEALPTLASVLQASGVKTSAVVTNYNLEESFGFSRGFDQFEYLGPSRYLGAPPKANRLAAYNVYRLVREKALPSARNADNFYRSGEWVNTAGLSLIDQIKGHDRFFAWLHYMEPHDPYFAEDGKSYARVSHPYPPAEWADGMRDAYRDDVRRFDDYFGQLLKKLDDRGLTDKVDIIVTADHGEEFFDHGGFYHGMTLYEEQLAVPLLVSGPQLDAGPRGELARQIDIAPTIASLLSVPVPSSWEGRSLLGSDAAPTQTLAEEDHAGHVLTSLRYTGGQAPMKIILANEGNPRKLPAVELFDLMKDPGEKEPIQMPSIEKQMRQDIDAAQAASKQGGAKAGTRAIDADAEAELRALGYIQ